MVEKVFEHVGPHQEGVAVRARRDRDVVGDLLREEPIRLGQIRRQRRRRQRREGAAREGQQHTDAGHRDPMSRRRDRRVPTAPRAAIDASDHGRSPRAQYTASPAPVGRATLGQCRLRDRAGRLREGSTPRSSTSRTVFIGHDPHFVPPLRRERRELFDRAPSVLPPRGGRLFLAQRDGRPVGRIEAIVNHAHNRFHDDRVGFFGAVRE